MAASRIKGIKIEINGDTTQLSSSLKEVDSQLKSTQSALKDVNNLLKLDPGNVELLRQKQSQLNESVTLTKDRLTQLQEAQSQVGEGTAEWDALQREIIATQQDLEGLEQQTRDFGSVTAQQVRVAGEKFKDIGSKIEGVGQKLAGVSAAAAGALGAIGKLGYDAVASADDLSTLSKQTGVSTDELQKWKYAADLVDVDVDTITGAMKKMKKGLDSNSGAFESLGVSTKDWAGNFRSSTDIFYDTILALSKIDNETKRDVMAMEIFGKSADDLAGVIDDGGAALKQYGAEAEQMGLIISGDTLNKLNDVNDTIDKMKGTVAASLAEAGATIAETFAPALEKVTGFIGQLAERIRELTPEQVKMITGILAVVAALSPALIIIGKLTSAVGGIMTAIPKVVGLLGAISGPVALVVAAIGALVGAFVYLYKTNDEFASSVNEKWTAIKEKAAELWEAIQPALEKIGAEFEQLMQTLAPVFQFLFDALAQVVSDVLDFAGPVIDTFSHVVEFISNLVSFFVALFTGDFDKAFESVKGMFNSFSAVVKGIMDTFYLYVQKIFSKFGIDLGALLEKFGRFGENIKTWLGKVLGIVSEKVVGIKNVIVEKIGAAVDFIKDLPSKALQWGRDLIQNFIDGIKNKIGAVGDAIGAVADKIASFIHFSLPDEGPLKNANTFMPDFVKLLTQGIEKGIPALENASSDMAAALVPGAGAVQHGPAASTVTNNTPVNITVYGAQGQDVSQLADIIQQRMNRAVMNQKAVFA